MGFLYTYTITMQFGVDVVFLRRMEWQWILLQHHYVKKDAKKELAISEKRDSEAKRMERRA